MVLASALLLASAPLNLSPAVRTFPEIASVLTPPGEEGTIRCDPSITHRAAFVGAKAISREGLMEALGLKLVPGDKGRWILKAADEAQERGWAEALRSECSHQIDRDVRNALAAVANGTGQSLGEEEWARYHDPLEDPAVAPEEKRRLVEAWSVRWGRLMASDKKRIATTLVLAAFPREVPMELFERGMTIAVLPLDRLPASAVAALRTAYPKLQGGPGTVVVHKTLLVDDMRLITVHATIVDVSGCFSMEGGAGANPIHGSSTGPTSFSASLLKTETNGGLKMRGYRAFIEGARAGEAEGRARVAEYLAEVPLPARPTDRASLSQIAAAWAAKGRDVILELSPKAEEAAGVLDGKSLRKEADWSPRVIEGTLVLRPLTRFLDARRRYPYAALRAYETARDAKDGTPEKAVAAYVKEAGPGDRFAFANYRGWTRCRLDGMAMARRLEEIVPAEGYRLAIERSKPITAEWARDRDLYTAGSWALPLAELSPGGQEVVADAMRWGWGDWRMDVVHSPLAWRAFLHDGVLRVNVGRPDASEATIGLYPDVKADPGSPWLSVGRSMGKVRP